MQMQEITVKDPLLNFESSVLDPILPHATPFKILTTPITAVGMGNLLLEPCKTSLSSPSFFQSNLGGVLDRVKLCDAAS